jgi:hypothetical protein
MKLVAGGPPVPLGGEKRVQTVLRGRNDQVAEANLLPGPSLGLENRHLHALRKKV